MAHELYILSDNTDPLWRRHLPGLDHSPSGSVLHITLPGSVPRYFDLTGWYKWLKRKQIDHIHAYDPELTVLPLLWLAARMKINIKVHLTAWPMTIPPWQLKFLSAIVNTFIVCGSTWALPLHKAGINSNKIEFELPEIGIIDSHRKDIDQLRAGDNRLVLALSRPDDHLGVNEALWTGALLKHVDPAIRLIVAGDCSLEDRQYLQRWEKVYDSEGMLIIHEQSDDWPELARIVDVVLNTERLPLNPLRILYARRANVPIISARKPYIELLRDYPHANLLEQSRPRYLAGAILRSISCVDRHS